LGPEINTDQCEMTASVSPDGKYLFFHRGGEDNGDIYWIDFRPTKKI
jgi:Tol biopolymer transport system component